MNPLAITSSAETEFPYIPFENWVGEKFIFLPLDKEDQHFGYLSIHKKGSPLNESTKYDELVGKVATVVSICIKWKEIANVDLQIEGTDAVYTTIAIHGCITNVAPLADVEAAPKKLLGKLLWVREDWLYIDDGEKSEEFLTKIPRFSKVEVTGIATGSFYSAPIRLIVQTGAGEVGYLDVSLSGTNVSKGLMPLFSFDSYFTLFDPHIKYDWPTEIWSAIEARQVIAGMSTAQARFALGEPSEIRKIQTEQDIDEDWIYSEEDHQPLKILHFSDGNVKSVE